MYINFKSFHSQYKLPKIAFLLANIQSFMTYVSRRKLFKPNVTFIEHLKNV